MEYFKNRFILKTFGQMNRILRFFWPSFFWCIGMIYFPITLMNWDLSFIPGDLGDARLNNYLLEHGFLWLIGEVHIFWNAPFFYPALNVMAFSDNHLGSLPIYTFFRLLTFDRETAFQLWILVLFSLNFISCYYILRQFKFSPFSAGAGAFVFTFSLPVNARLGHAQLLPRFLVPFGFYYAWRYLNTSHLKYLIGLSLSIVWQLYCTIYIGIFGIFHFRPKVVDTFYLSVI